MKQLAICALTICPLFVHSGDEIRARVYWPHESAPGQTYTVTIGPVLAWETGLAMIEAEGHPDGCRWWLNGDRVLFYDGFESGDTGQWEARP